MKRAFHLILTLLLLCLSAALVFAILPGPSGLSQMMGELVRAVFAVEESSPPPDDAPLPAEPDASPAAETPLPAAESSLPAAEPVPSVREAPSSQTEDPAPSAESSSVPAKVPPPAESSSVPAEAPPPAESSSAPGKADPVPPQRVEAWMLRLVNWENPLPMDFEPEYEAVQGRFVMDKRVAPIVRQMIEDAQAQGVTLVVNSAYRPYSAQQQVYDAQYQRYLEEGRSEQEAQWLTASYVAAPGCSEHQLGLAMDIVAVAGGERVDGWLAANAPGYGFILRYPEDKTEFTHTAYESWHYRYVGVPTAREITDQGLCLEEYLAKLEAA